MNKMMQRIFYLYIYKLYIYIHYRSEVWDHLEMTIFQRKALRDDKGKSLLVFLPSSDEADPGVPEDGHPSGRPAPQRPHGQAGGAHDDDQRPGPAARLHAAARQGGEPRGEEGQETSHQGGAHGEDGRSVWLYRSLRFMC